jgi:chromatin segregation and condensation protein Rec8/ScpA/Scc1 (kleisin family)
MPNWHLKNCFDQHPARMEIVTTFMALLEMISRGELLLRQPAPFAPINLRVRMIGEDEPEGEYMDEYTD